ncbi:MAG: hypothetical protein QOG87_857 [Actinomycetota bacterium]|jgi:hypothetical protein
MAQPGRQVAARDDDWTVQAADRIEGFVASIHDKTTVPLTTAARAIVYGILAAFAGGTALVLSAIIAVRGLDVITGEGNVWIAHGGIGMLFLLIGVLVWRYRRPSER